MCKTMIWVGKLSRCYRFNLHHVITYNRFGIQKIQFALIILPYK